MQDSTALESIPVRRTQLGFEYVVMTDIPMPRRDQFWASLESKHARLIVDGIGPAALLEDGVIGSGPSHCLRKKQGMCLRPLETGSRPWDRGPERRRTARCGHPGSRSEAALRIRHPTHCRHSANSSGFRRAAARLGALVASHGTGSMKARRSLASHPVRAMPLGCSGARLNRLVVHATLIDPIQHEDHRVGRPSRYSSGAVLWSAGNQAPQG